ncbi:MAG: glycoside hydrolase family 20 zincin-like fold domain-containing protein [Victivallaceae bacterium]|nr:glycoside hydrolase family 20 zincin-like fold domain-containing protein [Victivallaceae bacterium]
MKLSSTIMGAIVAGGMQFMAMGGEQPLTSQIKQRIQRQLFPLPKEVKFGQKLFSFAPGTCQLAITTKLNTTERQFVSNFKQQWQKKFHTSLKQSANTKSKLQLIIVKSDSHTAVGVNLKRIQQLPNSAQAYTVSTVISDGNLKIYLIFNDSPGLYYALETFNQLLADGSSNKKLVLPAITITDWPDIRYRGMWGGVRYPTGKLMAKELADFSAMKLNYWERPRMKVMLNSQNQVYYNALTPKLLTAAERYNIKLEPYITHLSGLFSSHWASHLGKLKDQLTAKGTKSYGKVWCWHKTESQEMLYQMMLKAAGTPGLKSLSIWLSEWGGTACQCDQCKGNVHDYFIMETANILKAYRRVKKSYPHLQLTILTTQTSYKFQDEILAMIPPEIHLDFYGGSGKGNTYQTTNQSILAGYPVEKLLKRGYKLGVLPLVISSHAPAIGQFPFYTPSLIKMRMSEVYRKKLERVIAYLPYNLYQHDINIQAVGEYAWNSNGRSLEQFAVSWSARQDNKYPAKTGKIITLLDHPGRILSMGIHADKFSNPLTRLVDRLLEVKSKYSAYFALLQGIDSKDKVTATENLLNDCQQALKLATQTGNQRLIAAAKLLRQWMRILHEYAKFNAKPDNKQLRDKVKQQIVVYVREIPQLWLNWIQHEQIPNKRRKKYIFKKMQKIMQIFKRLGQMPNVDHLADSWLKK